MRPAPTAPASLPVIRVGEDTVTLVGAHLAHVSSRSNPGMLHSVTDYRCSCTGFYHRNTCRHLTAVKTARIQHTVAMLAAEYAEYVAFAREHMADVMDVQTWYEERDYPEGEPEVEPLTVPNANGLIWAGYRRGWIRPDAL